MHLLEEGQSLRETYIVERFLGAGAFAEVYRVNHRFLGRQAMKVFKNVTMTTGDIEATLEEAILLSRLGHPNIVRVFDANVLESKESLCGYFTMEYVSGGSLDRFWRSFGTKLVPIDKTIEISRQICRGLAVAHSENPPIIHRDIKPQNILVDYEAEGLHVRVSDFGLAKRVNSLTLLATAAGTLAFKAPETFSSSKADSCSGDIWSLGVTMYLLLTDRLPYNVDPELGWKNRRAFEREILPPSELNLDVDEVLNQIVLKCLAIERKDRYGSATELLRDLNNYEWQCSIKQMPPNAATHHKTNKQALGLHSSLDEVEGARLAQKALQRAQNGGRLDDAADIMEEALNRAPSLRAKYASHIRLWRRGISM